MTFLRNRTEKELHRAAHFFKKEKDKKKYEK